MEQRETEYIKEWLQRYRQAALRSETLDYRVQEARIRSYSPRSQNTDGMPRAKGTAPDPVGLNVAILEELELEAKQARAEAIQLYQEIDNAIKQINGRSAAVKQSVLQMRYLDGMDWQDINEALHGDEEDFEDREESYLRRTFRTHGEGLKELKWLLKHD